MVLAHGNPGGFAELARQLRSPRCGVVAHVDAKADVTPFRESSPEVIFTGTRFDVRWGRWSQVQADLELLRTALDYLGGVPGHLVLISGDSYPVAETNAIADFFSHAADTQFYNVAPMPAPHLHKPMTQMTRRFIIDYDHRNGRRNLAPKIVNNIVPLNWRRGLGGLKPMCGSAWWAITSAAAQWVIDYTDAHPRLTQYFARTRCPDEKYFQTLLESSPFANARQGSPMFSDFTRADGPSPAFVDERMIQQILSWESVWQVHAGYGTGPKLFVRKFPANAPHLYEWMRARVIPSTTARLAHSSSACYELGTSTSDGLED
jgi:hypothetical protein